MYRVMEWYLLSQSTVTHKTFRYEIALETRLGQEANIASTIAVYTLPTSLFYATAWSLEEPATSLKPESVMTWLEAYQVLPRQDDAD
jgi:hypothetical protein